ncbi:MAG: GNAT family N-acetyltransferase [Rhizobiaceae bacterium]
MSETVILETERLSLRRHTIDDFADMVVLWGEPEVTLYTAARKASSREECWQRLLRYHGLWSLLGYGYFAIIEKSSGTFVGEAGLADFHRDIEPSLSGYAEAGWALLPSHWGKGYAQEALMAVFNWYAEKPNPLPLACIIDPENSASIKLAEKVGFRLKSSTTYKGTPCLMFERS